MTSGDLITTEETTIVLVPESELADINKLDVVVSQCRLQVEAAGPTSITAAFVKAKALAAIRGAISDSMLKDIKMMMNDPAGFKTDRPNNSNKTYYDDKTIVDSVCTALIQGAALIGNEFNIIAGNPYLTKEYFFRKVREYPGVTLFRDKIGVPVTVPNTKFAVCSARATWVQDGVPQKLGCVKDGEFDGRVVVNWHASDGPDNTKGKVKRKLYAMVWEAITGKQVDDAGDDKPPAIEPGPDTPLIESESQEPGQTRQIVDAMIIGGLDTIKTISTNGDMRTHVRDFKSVVASMTSLTDDEKAHCVSEIVTASELKLDELRSQ